MAGTPHNSPALKGALHTHTTCSDGELTPLELLRVYRDLGFDFVALGRALLAEPDLINRIQADGDAHTVKSLCTHCNKCMPTIYSRTLCVETGAPA